MNTQINAKELIEILKILPPEQNIMLSGRHGIGKSQILTNYFESKNIKVITLFLGQMSDPGDLLGLPHFNEATKLTEFMPPYWFPVDNKPIVLFLDELNRARPEILQTIMDLALNKKLAGRSLPKDSRIISAVNSGDEYDLTELDPALVSRFNVYDFKPDANDWILWAKKNNIDSRIIDYIQLKPIKLDFAEKNNSENCLEKTPDRRGWEKVSNAIKDVEKFLPIHAKVISGIIGQETALDFIAVESKRSVLNVTGYDILNKGKEVFASFKPLTLPDYCEVIDGIFAILEEIESTSELQKKVYIQNLTDFIEDLNVTHKYEAIAYFISVYAENKNTSCKDFIHSDCSRVFDFITAFVKEYKID